MVKQGREEYIRLQQIVSNELTGNKDKKRSKSIDSNDSSRHLTAADIQEAVHLSSAMSNPSTNLSAAMAYDQESSNSVYNPLPNAILSKFLTSSIHPSELLRRVEALDIPPLPIDLGVSGITVSSSSHNTSSNNVTSNGRGSGSGSGSTNRSISSTSSTIRKRKKLLQKSLTMPPQSSSADNTTTSNNIFLTINKDKQLTHMQSFDSYSSSSSSSSIGNRTDSLSTLATLPENEATSWSSIPDPAAELCSYDYGHPDASIEVSIIFFDNFL
jgi:hypothetical protein